MTEDSSGEDDTGPDRENIGKRAADDFSAFTSFTVQFYRGEMDRITTWRRRLDQTTNWAVIVIAGILTWAFSSADNPHYVILIGVLTTTAFLIIEANRFRKYDAWRARIRLLQENLFANLYDPEALEHRDWRAQLSIDLRDPELTMPFWKAAAHRLRHVYFLLLSVLLAAWIFRLTAFTPNRTWRETAAIGDVSGDVVVGFVAAWYLVFAALTLASIYGTTEREFEQPSGEEDWTRTD